MLPQNTTMKNSMHNGPREPIDLLLTPFQRFARLEAGGGILLLVAALAAMFWANSSWSEIYFRIWQTPLGVGLGDWSLTKPLSLWINDGLMAVFFFVVGLEIKREMLVGEFADPRNALLPIAAAIGGMVVPALFYLLLTPAGEAATGWGVPMATDIAFALAVVALLGKRVPQQLKVVLTAVAIVDDIGAILVIALFYTAAIDWSMLLAGLVMLAVMFGMNRAGLRHPLPYVLVGALVWFGLLKSGVHATVLTAFAIPARPRLDCAAFTNSARAQLERFSETRPGDCNRELTREQQHALGDLQSIIHDAHQPLLELEHALHPWVSFLILPIFALANAGVPLGGDVVGALLHPVSLGIVLGLVAGKPLGVLAASWGVLALGLARPPEGVSLAHLAGAGCLAGIGFTMSIFVAGLAFADGSTLEGVSKFGVLSASAISGLIGWSWLRFVSSRKK
jgi:NhaA family Na+:H+ antiporter